MCGIIEPSKSVPSNNREAAAEVALFGEVAKVMAGKSEAEIIALCDRLEAFEAA
jgi:hypothetical protein